MATTAPTRVSATELAHNLSDILNRINYGGESFVVERNGKEIASLGPPQGAGRPTIADLVQVLSELPRLGPDFADDVEAVISRRTATEPPVWE